MRLGYKEWIRSLRDDISFFRGFLIIEVSLLREFDYLSLRNLFQLVGEGETFKWVPNFLLRFILGLPLLIMFRLVFICRWATESEWLNTISTLISWVILRVLNAAPCWSFCLICACCCGVGNVVQGWVEVICRFFFTLASI